MPGLEINSHGIPAVATIGAYLNELLNHAETVKPTRALEPALTISAFDDIYGHVATIFEGFSESNGKKLRQYAIVETAARDIFGELIASTSIDSADFVRVWNLFDILAILSDNMDCDAPLLFWLIEELLDSQTISGCRKVFDYLESRRERITAKYFNSTKLVILRSCNDLLRRLSRAEDTPFCGRVFIFLFQVFPLGDKSSVNLRGEYHVENVTTYDETSAGASDSKDAGAMDVDDDLSAKKSGDDAKAKIDFSALYAAFWSLQASFSQPKKLFEPASFSNFKTGMEASLAAFKQISNQDDSRRQRTADESKRGVKRRHDGESKEDESVDMYNPKYLTSRDLFELETSDLTFRRHFLLQALILMEFLLSLSPKAKGKLAGINIQNKSVTYSEHTLSEEDAAWAAQMKHDITEHIKSSNVDGPYFLRMVDTILARDKNWVLWKVESCPSIERPPVSPEEFAAAKDGAQRAFGRHRRRSSAMLSFSLDFLDEEDPDIALEELKKPHRSQLGALDKLGQDIAEDDFDIDMTNIDASKQEAQERKASKTWRALRVVRQTRMSTFDKIDDDSNIQLVFNTTGEGDDDALDGEIAEGGAMNNRAVKMPENMTPVVLVGPTGQLASSFCRLLVAQNPGVFGIVGQCTTRPATSSSASANKTLYHYVEAKAFEILKDGDEFVAFGETSGFEYGTRRKQIEAVTVAGKIPLILMNYESVNTAKENEVAARYVFVKPAAVEGLEALLKASDAYGVDTAVQDAMAAAKSVLENASHEQGLFDKIVEIIGSELEGAASNIKDYIYGAEGKDATECGKEEEITEKEEEAVINEIPADTEPAKNAEPSKDTGTAEPAGDDTEMADTGIDAMPSGGAS